MEQTACINVRIKHTQKPHKIQILKYSEWDKWVQPVLFALCVIFQGNYVNIDKASLAIPPKIPLILNASLNHKQYHDEQKH